MPLIPSRQDSITGSTGSVDVARDQRRAGSTASENPFASFRESRLEVSVDSRRAEAAGPAGRALAMGSRVADKYRVVALLGSGSWGHGCIGVDERPSAARRLVALTTVGGEQRPSSATIAGFVHDGRLRERMNHPNVAQTLELVQHDGLPVLVTEYLEGESLATLLALAFGMPEFSLEVRLTILAQAARGLAHVHQLVSSAVRPSALAHADVSPHDIVITYDGNVKLSGFGSAAGRRSSAALAPDNLEYLAPERLHGTVLPSSNVFSFGVLLWELIALQRFWNHLPDYEVRRCLIAFDIPDVERLKPHVAGELGRVCRQALAPDPARRYPSAAELSIDLDRFLVARSAVAAPAAIALVMNHACGALQREARLRLGSALDSVPEQAPRSRHSWNESAIWRVWKRERPMSRSGTAALAAGAFAALLIATIASRSRTTPSGTSTAKPVSIEAMPVKAVPVEAVPVKAVPVDPVAPSGQPRTREGSTLAKPSPRPSTTRIETLLPDPEPPRPRAKPKPERAQPAQRRARRPTPPTQLQAHDTADGATGDPELTIRLER